MNENAYEKQLRQLQIELVKFQRHLIKNHLKILIIFEGRDAAGKDGIIKRVTEHLSPRDTRIVALQKPTDYETKTWYFQRYIAELPAEQEMVVMNRSWYNRAGVERVMGFCTDEQYNNFMESVVTFEQLLVDAGIQIIKYYLDISQHEQVERIKKRKADPLRSWKAGPIDDAAVKLWDEYTAARNDMLLRTNHEQAPWYIVSADKKKIARLNVIRHMLSRFDCPGKNTAHTRFNKSVVFPFEARHLKSNKMAS